MIAALIPTGGAWSALALPEAALLWSMRAWVAAQRRKPGPVPSIDLLFDELGAPEAAGYVQGFMWVLAQGAVRRLAVHAPCCHGLSEDEQDLLDFLALTQDGQVFERRMLLRALVRAPAMGPLQVSATGAVAACNRAGLVLVPVQTSLRLRALPYGTAP